MSAPIRCLIVDDEALGRKNLELALIEHRHCEVVACAASVAQARLMLSAARPDLIFLDIQMPRENGMALAQELMLWTHPPLIIFVTAFNEHAIQAFRLHALDYLLKPIDDVHLRQAIERAAGMLQLRQQANYATAIRHFMDAADGDTSYWRQLSVRSVGRIDLVPLREVFWIEAQGNYMQLHLEGRKILYRAAMTQLEKHLDPASFIRVHRRYIVRIDQIEALQVLPDHSHQALLRCGDGVAISERYIGAVKAALR